MTTIYGVAYKHDDNLMCIDYGNDIRAVEVITKTMELFKLPLILDPCYFSDVHRHLSPIYKDISPENVGIISPGMLNSIRDIHDSSNVILICKTHISIESMDKLYKDRKHLYNMEKPWEELDYSLEPIKKFLYSVGDTNKKILNILMES